MQKRRTHVHRHQATSKQLHSKQRHKTLEENAILKQENKRLSEELSLVESYRDSYYSISNSLTWKIAKAVLITPSLFLKRLFSSALNVAQKSVPKELQISAAKKISRVRSPRQKKVTPQKSSSNEVYILSPAFFDKDGNNMFFGGAERYLIDLAELISAKGYTPVVFQPGNFEWTRYYNQLRVQSLVSHQDVDHLDKLFAQKAKHGALAIYHAFYLAKHRLPIPSIGISHGVYWDNAYIQASKNVFQHQVDSIHQSIARLDHLVSVDTNTLNVLRATKFHLSQHASYIPNYVDRSQFSPTQKFKKDRITVLYPRRLYEARGIDITMQAFAKLFARYSNLDLLLVGKANKEDTRTVNKFIKEHQGRVRWISLPPERMHEAYEASDIAIIPTKYSEGTSLSCLEALASGCVTIATDVGGLPNIIIHKHNGLLIAPTSDDLVRAISEVLEDEALTQKLMNNGIQSSEAFCKDTWKQSWSTLLDTYLSERPEHKHRQIQIAYPQTPGITFTDRPDKLYQQRPQHLLRALAHEGVEVFAYSDTTDSSERNESDGSLNILIQGDDLYLNDAFIYIHYPLNRHLIPEQQRSRIVYDILDDTSIFKHDLKYDKILAAHKSLLKESAHITTSSIDIFNQLNSKPEYQNRLSYIPNAVDLEHFQPTTPITISGIAKHQPVIGYIGDIGEHLDYTLIEHVSQKLAHFTFIFIGNESAPTLRELSKKYKNIKLLGKKSYNDLPQYLERCDVCIIPFITSTVTEHVSPVKLFEYLAMGKPVVTTSTSELRQYDHIIHCCSDATTFADAIEKAYEQRHQDREERRNLATQHDWKTRARTLIDHLS